MFVIQVLITLVKLELQIKNIILIFVIALRTSWLIRIKQIFVGLFGVLLNDKVLNRLFNSWTVDRRVHDVLFFLVGLAGNVKKIRSSYFIIRSWRLYNSTAVRTDRRRHNGRTWSILQSPIGQILVLILLFEFRAKPDTLDLRWFAFDLLPIRTSCLNNLFHF